MAAPRSPEAAAVIDRLAEAGYPRSSTRTHVPKLNSLSDATLAAAAACLASHSGSGEKWDLAAPVLLYTLPNASDEELRNVVVTYDPKGLVGPLNGPLDLVRGLRAYGSLLPGCTGGGLIPASEMAPAHSLLMVGWALLAAEVYEALAETADGGTHLRDLRLAALVASQPERAEEIVALVVERRIGRAEVISAALAAPSALAAGAL